MPSNQSVMNFLKKIANNRSTYDVYLVLQKVIDINKRNRPKNYKKRIKKIIDPIIARINNAGNVQQIKAVLSKERIRFKSGDKRIARAIEISYKIVQDGIQNGIYSIGKLRRHSPSRGFWGDTVDAIKDTVADIVKNDAEGAIVGGAYGAAVGGVTGAGVLVTSTAGAVAGACEASSISTVGLIFDLVMHPSPAY